MALKFEKIKQILNQGCNVVYRLKLEVDAYKSVIDVWKTYKRVNTLSIVTSDRRIIKEIFDFHKTINDHVILYFSRKKPNNISKSLWRYIDLDKKINNIPKKVDKIFFFSSPYYKSSNLRKKNFIKELSWLKKIIKKTKTKIFIYLSSSSVYLKNHPVGTAKLICEKYLVNNSNFNYLQIWRPYNLVGNDSLNLSDHFHNILIKKFCIEKKEKHNFNGSGKDVRGYSSVKKFCKTLINFKQNIFFNCD